MQGIKVGRREHVKLTIDEYHLIDFMMLDLDAETATLICGYYGEGLRYKEIAQRLYNECQIQVTGTAINRISRLLKRGREQILASRLGKDDLTIYPEIARTAILNILARYAPINDKDPKKGRPAETKEPTKTISNLPSGLEDGKSPLKRIFHLKKGIEIVYFINPWSLGGLALTFLWWHFVDKRAVNKIAEQFYDGDSEAASDSIAQEMRRAIEKILQGPGSLEGLDGRARTLHKAVEDGNGRLRWKRWGGEEKRPEQSTPSPTSIPTQQPAKPPRSCPRCTGMMLFEEDWRGAYSTCLSCGYVYEFGATAALELKDEVEHQQPRRRPSHGKLRL